MPDFIKPQPPKKPIPPIIRIIKNEKVINKKEIEQHSKR